jgi:ribosomal protein S18 acetylase RimI-like enzyme
MIEQLSEISKVSIHGVESLRTISTQTFTETFAHQNSESDIHKYVSEKLSVEQLSKELNSKGSSFYFLKLNTQIIGYLKLNTGEAQTELKNSTSIEIERIYIKKEFHSKGFGELLLKHAIDVAKQQQVHYIWLGVWEENFKAISFYKRNGFHQFDTHIFKLGEDEQLDILMKLELN